MQRDSSLRQRFGLADCVLLAALSFAPCPASAGLSEPDTVVLGSIGLDGLPVTASARSVVVEARRAASGAVVASYAMGSEPLYGNQYVLRLPVENGTPLSDPLASLPGDSLVVVVRDASGDRYHTPLVVTGRGLFVRMDFGDIDSDGDGMSDKFELQYFGSATGGDPNQDSDGDGRPNLREFLQGTNPLVADGRHPADVGPADNRLTSDEVTAYTAAWLSDTPWSVEPFDIPVAYATRAGALWKGGEAYVFSGVPRTNAPMWWVNTTKPATAAPATADPASRVVDAVFKAGYPLHVEIHVTPAPGIAAYAVEETPPAGWLVRNISDGGRYRAARGRIKWGLFFDTQPHTLSYDAVPLPTAGDAGLFAGSVSQDGINASVTGRTVVSSQTATPVAVTFLNIATGAGSRLAFDVQGAPGTAYRLQTSTDLQHWTDAQGFTTDGNGRSHIAPTVAGSVAFFKVVKAASGN